MDLRVGAGDRFWLIVFGLGIISLAIFNEMKMGSYPLGDVRNEPVFWVIALGFACGLGGLSIIGGMRGVKPRLRKP